MSVLDVVESITNIEELKMIKSVIKFSKLLDKDKFIDVVEKIDKGTINSKVFKDILNDLMECNDSVDEIISKKGIKIISDPTQLNSIIKTVLDNNQSSVNDYKNGNERAIKFLMGQIMKETKGSANPELVNKLLLEKLSK